MKKEKIAKVLAKTPMTSILSMSQEMNMSKSLVHRTMRHALKYRSYELYLTQQVYDDDHDLGVEMAELLTSIIDNQENYGFILFSICQ